MNWAYNVKILLNNLGFRIYWQCQDIFTPTFCELKLHVRHQYYQEWHSSCILSSKLCLYNMFKSTHCFEKYLSCITVPKYRISLTGIRA